MTFSKIAAVCIVVGLGISALFLYFRPLGQQKEQLPQEKFASPRIQTRQTALFFSPAVTKLIGFQEHTIAVMIDTHANEISAAQLEISYDPSRIIVISIQPAEFFSTLLQPVNTHDRSRGRIDFVITLPENQPPVSGQGTLALITLTRNPSATQSALTQISLLPKTAVRGTEQNDSLLKSTGRATIELEAVLPEIQP